MFTRKIYTYPLILIACNSCLGLVHIIFTLIYGFFQKNDSKFFKFLGFKNLIFLALFVAMPYIQLFISFLGELIAEKLNPGSVLIFCMVYPITMGAAQKFTSFLNKKNKMNLEMLAEANSVFFASTPYKLIYLNVEETWFAFTVLGIKIVYKLIGFVFIPLMKKKSSGKVESNKLMKMRKKGRSNKKKRSTLSGIVTKIFDDDDDNDEQLFSLKFFILQIFDLSSNIAIFSLVIANNVVIWKLMGYRYVMFTHEFIQKISLWTTVRSLN